jgi:hypothetical protein
MNPVEPLPEPVLAPPPAPVPEPEEDDDEEDEDEDEEPLTVSPTALEIEAIVPDAGARSVVACTASSAC